MSVMNLPSWILGCAQVSTFRQFADVVFRSVQQSRATTALLTNSFVNASAAEDYVAEAVRRINATDPHDPDQEDEELCILPPLFLQSKKNLFFKLKDTLIGLVMFETGPVLPFIRIAAGTTILGDTTTKSTLFRLYELMPDFKIDSPQAMQQVCDAQKHKKRVTS